ncbi:hypothetical protein I6G82_12250 [Lysinibacillus macroides]|uniref:Uncharacterized protein n=1 Tax=Lysinibacillus macroides TaxID=33935 RepID=A0A0N0CWB3_9BACI|nr:hypothetical protein [Lysinibacillus macroides]KOY82874.1 hypothetical protein ADM90_06010 [Lysinibacillus macroides]QPR66078.1 hypothetical protein I6G82_12250 [Lysinibacillus macroides]
MSRTVSIFYHASIIAVSFVCGVIFFHIIGGPKAEPFILLIEPRLADGDRQSIFRIVLPVVISIGLILLLATHSYLKILIRVTVAMRATFFGFSSVFLLQKLEAFWLYTIWWFPFQLIYCILLLVLCNLLVPAWSKRKIGKQVSGRTILLNFIAFFIIIVAEFIVVFFVLK